MVNNVLLFLYLGYSDDPSHYKSYFSETLQEPDCRDNITKVRITPKLRTNTNKKVEGSSNKVERADAKTEQTKGKVDKTKGSVRLTSKDNDKHKPRTNERNRDKDEDNDMCVEMGFSEVRLPRTALASFPGSGNTWLRHLVEQLTGETLQFVPLEEKGVKSHYVIMKFFF